MQEIRAEIDQSTKFPGDKDDELPERKKLKLDTTDGKLKRQSCAHSVRRLTSVRSSVLDFSEKMALMELDRAEREIEQLKVDHEIAIEKREKQVGPLLALSPICDAKLRRLNS